MGTTVVAVTLGSNIPQKKKKFQKKCHPLIYRGNQSMCNTVF